MRYSDELLDEIRAQNPIVDVIGSYVSLQRAGTNYRGLCPFHNEKTGSFMVSPGKGIYHCFGCGAGGNVFTFIQQYENVSFFEAVRALAKRAGIPLPAEDQTEEQKKFSDFRAVMLEIQRKAAVFYVHVLKSEEGKIGRDYFKKRELSDETIRSFGLGYAGQHPNALYSYLRKEGYSDAQLKETGLFTFSEKGVTDKFFNRVMFPIMDSNSRVIGFGGRVMGMGEPKYLNSPETKIFSKGKNLFALNAAKKTKEDYYLICEGYMDVISLHQHGFTNAVASLGTAFTEGHAGILKRHKKDAILCYDCDGAGKKAALRAIPILRNAGIKVKVLDLSPYKDPDDFMKGVGEEEFRKRIRDAMNAFRFEIRAVKEQYDLEDPGEKAEFFKELAKRLAGFSDEIERNSYTEDMAREHGIDYGILKNKVTECLLLGEKAAPPDEEWKPSPVKSASQIGKRNPDAGLINAEKLILTDLSEEPSHYRAVSQYLSVNEYYSDLAKQLLQSFYDGLMKGEVNIAALMDSLDEEQQKECSSLFNYEPYLAMEEDARREALADAIRKLKGASLEKKISECTDGNVLKELMNEKQKLQRIEIKL